MDRRFIKICILFVIFLCLSFNLFKKRERTWSHYINILIFIFLLIYGLEWIYININDKDHKYLIIGVIYFYLVLILFAFYLAESNIKIF